MCHGKGLLIVQQLLQNLMLLMNSGSCFVFRDLVDMWRLCETVLQHASNVSQSEEGFEAYLQGFPSLTSLGVLSLSLSLSLFPFCCCSRSLAAVQVC